MQAQEVREKGMTDRTVTLDDDLQIVDGRHREALCFLGGVEPRRRLFRDLKFSGTIWEFSLLANGACRHNTKAQLALIGARNMERFSPARTGKPGRASEHMADLLGVSERMIYKAKSLLGHDDLLDEVWHERISLDEALIRAGLAPPKEVGSAPADTPGTATGLPAATPGQDAAADANAQSSSLSPSASDSSVEDENQHAAQDTGVEHQETDDADADAPEHEQSSTVAPQTGSPVGESDSHPPRAQSPTHKSKRARDGGDGAADDDHNYDVSSLVSADGNWPEDLKRGTLVIRARDPRAAFETLDTMRLQALHDGFTVLWSQDLHSGMTQCERQAIKLLERTSRRATPETESTGVL